MKIVLVHDYIKEYGGAERVLEALHELYPDAPVYTSVYLPSYLGPHRDRFKNWDIRTSWAQYLPFKAKLISPLRLLSPLLFKSFDFSKYDVVITSATGAYFPNSIKTKPHPNPLLKREGKQGAAHISYCHTPPRYLYGYATAREWKKNVFFKVIGGVANHILRMVDFSASQNVDLYIANSEEVAGRIKKFYRKEAIVVYPPVDVNSKLETRNSKLQDNRSYFLAGGRLARPKHIELIIKTANEMKLPLKIFGKAFAGYGEELKKLAEGTVEFMGEVADEEKLSLMRNARAYIMAAEEEDFGILPVEAMAQGTPVIAYRSGGVKETILDGKTGLFFDELTVDSLKKTIKQFNNLPAGKAGVTISSEACQKRAEEFSEEKFKEKIKEIVSKYA